MPNNQSPLNAQYTHENSPLSIPPQGSASGSDNSDADTAMQLPEGGILPTAQSLPPPPPHPLAQPTTSMATLPPGMPTLSSDTGQLHINTNINQDVMLENPSNIPPTNPHFGIPSPSLSQFLFGLIGIDDLTLRRIPSSLPQFDATAFVDSLSSISIDSIEPEDMRCPHCWCDFGTSGDGLQNNDPVKTPCGHMIGKDCLLESLKKTNTRCPVCRQEFDPAKQ
jgi:hypothetical protein